MGSFLRYIDFACARACARVYYNVAVGERFRVWSRMFWCISQNFSHCKVPREITLAECLCVYTESLRAISHDVYAKNGIIYFKFDTFIVEEPK